jgi:hypothetical protein
MMTRRPVEEELRSMHRSALIGAVRARAARQRSALFRRFVAGLPRPLRIIDLGGSAQMWSRWGVTAADGLQIVLANDHRMDTTHRSEALPGRFISSWAVDVLDLLPSSYEEFDVVFSNSMLEHLPSRDAQQRLAATIAATGKPYFIQVPNRRCIVDPHFPHPLAAFFGLWPRDLQVWAHHRHALGSTGRAKTREAAAAAIDSYHPFSRRDLARLFPDAAVVTEWNLGLPMSLVALGGAAS